MWLLRNAGFSVCGVRQNLYVFNCYRNPDLDDRIFDCLLTSMDAVQAENACASFLFVGNLNGLIRSGWVLQPQIVMVLQPLTSQLCLVNCDQLVVGSTHARGGILDLVMTDVPDLVYGLLS